MNPLYTVALPRLSATDQAFIDRVRAEHDSHSGSLLAAHFTFLFACAAVPADIYRAHVSAIAAAHSAIKFTCRYAMAASPASERRAYVYLVPDEGFSAMGLLHDALYTGVMAPHLRSDPAFTPHITLAAVASAAEAQRIAASLNAQGLEIQGTISELRIGSVGEGAFIYHAAFPLQS